jgi:hypothetical protein
MWWLPGEGASTYASLGLAAGIAVAVVAYAVLTQSARRLAEERARRMRKVAYWGWLAWPIAGYAIGRLIGR